MPLTISIASQKGGVGKSTLTAMLASQLHYVEGIHCVAVDADYPQDSLYALREREKLALAENAAFRGLCERFYGQWERGMYPVLRLDKGHYQGSLPRLLSSLPEEGADAVFVDLPGTVNRMDVLETLLEIEYLFIPVVPDRMVLEGTLSFHLLLGSMREKFSSRCHLKEVRYFFTQVDRRVRVQGVTERYSGVFEKAGMVFLESVLPRSARFGKEPGDASVYRSTLLPMSPSEAASMNIKQLTNEIISVCQLQQRKRERGG